MASAAVGAAGATGCAASRVDLLLCLLLQLLEGLPRCWGAEPLLSLNWLLLLLLLLLRDAEWPACRSAVSTDSSKQY